MPVDCYLFALTISAIWFGAILGVSVIATLAKFQAKTLSRPVALEVGKVTFKWFTKTEWAIFLLLCLPLLFCTQSSKFLPALFLLLGILSLQSFWLLPVLAKRADSVALKNSDLPKSQVHSIYVIAEPIKLLLLIAIAWSTWSIIRSTA